MVPFDVTHSLVSVLKLFCDHLLPLQQELHLEFCTR